MTLLNSCDFFMLKCYPLLIAVFGMDGCFYMCATVCFFGAFYAIQIMPETKGKTLQEILRQLDR